MRRKLFLFCFFTTLSVCLAASGGDRVRTWLTQAGVDEGVRHGHLVLYPIVASQGTLPNVMTMDQAMKAEVLEITEVSDRGSVNRLLLSNEGGVPVFIMAGEILDGAKQDRVLKHDLWLPPHSDKIDVGAFCVEQGRWAYESTGSKVFKSSSTIANLNVRAQARAVKDQSAVWQAVEETQRKAGYAAPTQSLNAAYEDRKVQTDVEGYMKALGGLPRENTDMMGVVVQVGHEIIAVDCFSKRDLLLGLWPKMLKSYALEAVARKKVVAEVDRVRAQRFVRLGAACQVREEANPGSGTLLELNSAKIQGEALVLPQGIVHLELFASVPHTPVVPLQRDYP
jgi:ARG and Rhodanese-Phosphatase-superfamily-associated Protein domain